jgi:hypothetical protein
MLQNPDISPSASINRWIVSILTFHFELVHVPGTHHGPDGLSRRTRQPGDEDEPEDDFDDWIDNLYGFVHMINTPIRRKRVPTAQTFALAQEEPAERLPIKVPLTPKARKKYQQLADFAEWHRTLCRPAAIPDDKYPTFMRLAVAFFLDADRLWKKDPQGRHKLVVSADHRLAILTTGHDDAAHKGFFATNAIITERFWWPQMRKDIRWFVQTCHLCQIRQVRQVLIPPTVATPAPLFAKMYMDTMRLPASGGFKMIVQGRCSLSHYPEFRALRSETAEALAKWIFEDIICRWGTLVEIVSDNGSPFVAALGPLSKKYCINYIRISGYNSRANGIAERPHFDVRQALFKAADGDQSRWHQVVHSVFWADRVTTRRRMGCSPYYAVTGTQPLLPMDIAEATYLLPPPESVLSTTELISRRAVALQKRTEDLERLHSAVFEARLRAAQIFEKEHSAVIKDFDFKLGDLVLIRHTEIEKSLNRKMRPRYLGPLIVITRNRGGAYILCELDGTVLDRPVAAFRVIPYLARRSIPLPDLKDLIDIPTERLRELESSGEEEEDEEDI